jgi:hypothetical protein
MSDIEQDDAAFRELELALLYSRPLPALRTSRPCPVLCCAG